jgi:polysaccharide deacetylase 2 family uncharacterized protein YibQ
MEPVRGKKSWLGPGAITVDLSDDEIRRRVIAALDDIPHVTGINNHMGSRVTADARIMRIVLEICKERGIYYLDSRTTFKTVVPKLAAEIGVRTTGNDLFFDDSYSRKHIAGQVRKLQKRLKDDYPASVAIGHVGPPGLHTASLLKEAIPGMQTTAQFVVVSQLVK